jgi:hypothetical protein
MTALINVAFESFGKNGIVVRVTRHCYPPNDRPTWILTVRSATNVVLLQRFTSLDRALGFAAEALSGNMS